MRKKTILTYEGLKKLENELDDLKINQRKAVAEKIKEAREQGDITENADYDAARAKQAEVEAEIKQIKEKLDNVSIIEEGTKNSSSVKIGSFVTLLLGYNNQEVEYQIVGTTEADPKKFKISNECGLAKAIINHKVGEEVTVKANKEYTVKILATSTKSKNN